MAHIFISYSHSDKPYAQKLEKYLREHGFDVWIDKGIPPGSNWRSEIVKGIDGCFAVIVIMTPEASSSDSVQIEYGYALDQRKQILPLLRAGEVFPFLAIKQYTDVTEGQMPGKSFLEQLSTFASRNETEPDITFTPQTVSMREGGIMNSPFDITVPTNTIIFDKNRQGVAPFTVKNTSRRRLRASAKLATLPPDAAQWLTILSPNDGSTNTAELRDFPIDNTQQFQVKVTLPIDATPGSYTMTLTVADEGNPDDNYAVSPDVVFTAPTPVPQPTPRFRRWIVPALIVAVIVIILIVLLPYQPFSPCPLWMARDARIECIKNHPSFYFPDK